MSQPKRLAPFGFAEAGQGGGVGDEQGALDEHAVGGQQGELLILGHLRQAGGQGELAVFHAAGVEEAAQGEPAEAMPLTQLGFGGAVFSDVAGREGDRLLFEPEASLAACAARRVFKKKGSHGGYHTAPGYGRQGKCAGAALSGAHADGVAPFAVRVLFSVSYVAASINETCIYFKLW